MNCELCKQEIEKGEDWFMCDFDIKGNKEPCHTDCYFDALYEARIEHDDSGRNE